MSKETITALIDNYAATIKTIAKTKVEGDGQVPGRGGRVRQSLDNIARSISIQLDGTGHEVAPAAVALDQDDGHFHPAKNRDFLNVHRANLKNFKKAARKVEA